MERLADSGTIAAGITTRCDEGTSSRRARVADRHLLLAAGVTARLATLATCAQHYS
jgi:hypothetical protein